MQKFDHSITLINKYVALVNYYDDDFNNNGIHDQKALIVAASPSPLLKLKEKKKGRCTLSQLGARNIAD